MTTPVAHRWRWPAVIVLVATVPFVPGLWGPFVFDDQHTIVENPAIKSVFPLSRSLSSPLEGPLAGRPLASLSFAISWAMFGGEPFGHRLFNLVLHAMTACVLFVFVAAAWRRRQTTIVNDPESPNASERVALWVTLLWACHPLHAETVLYATQRTAILAGLFSLLALAFAAEANVGKSAWRSGWAILCCVLGLFCKENVAVVPLLVVAYDRAFVDATWATAIRRRWPLYAGLAATWVVLPLVSLGTRSKTAGWSLELTTFDYLRIQGWAIATYLRNAVWPFGIPLDYGDHVHGQLILADPMRYAPGFALVTALGLATLWAWWRNPPLAYLGTWFFVLLGPTSSLVPINTEIAASRRMYLPLVAVVVLGLLLVRVLGRRVGNASLLQPVCACGLLVLAGSSFGHAMMYDSDLDLWHHSAETYPDNPRAVAALSGCLLQRGRNEEALRVVDEVLQRHSEDGLSHYSRATALAANGRVPEAITAVERALELGLNVVNEPTAHYDLGNYQARMGDTEAAVAAYRRALELAPGLVVAHVNLGVLFHAEERLPEAIEHYTAAVELAPNLATARYGLGVALFFGDRPAEAEPHLRRAVDLDPRYAPNVTQLLNAAAANGNR